MGLVLSVTVVIPEGGESGVFGRMGVGCPAGVPCGEVFVWICALMAAPAADCMWVIGTKLPGICCEGEMQILFCDHYFDCSVKEVQRRAV